jgi:xanthine dehydrogenase YagR molybdenum-binding subunit
MTTAVRGVVGVGIERVDARAKVTGEALYAYERTGKEIAYLALVQSTIARGTITRVDADEARSLPGVLAVISHENALPLGAVESGEWRVFQSPRVAYRGQIVAAVVAERLEIARDAAARVRPEYEAEPHDVELRPDHPSLTRPPHVLGSPTDTSHGDLDERLAESAVVVDEWYRTQAQHALPLEPHATLAVWEGDAVTLYEATQSPALHQGAIAGAFGLEPARVRVICENVGGGFGSKGEPHPHSFATVMAARMVGRPVKCAPTRRQMFALTGYRTPTIQHVRIGADADGRLLALAHEAFTQTSTLYVHAEPVGFGARDIYRAASGMTSHRIAALDVPTPSYVRGPGHTPGSFGLESALDELAERLGIDPVELRLRNEPERDPESGLPFSSRDLVGCLREGVERFGWPRPPRRDGRWLVGAGMAVTQFPALRFPASATVRLDDDGCLTVAIAASDIGNGSRTVLAQIAADALEVPIASVRLELGDSSLPWAFGAAASSGTASWGTAIVEACRELRRVLPDTREATVHTGAALQTQAPEHSTSAHGVQLAEVRVDAVTCEIRVSELLGVFAAGRIVNPRLARSQLIGGMTWGLGFALLEESVFDPRFGDVVNGDLAGYHVASCADVERIDAILLDQDDAHVNPMGTKGIGEIGMVGVAAAIANAVYAATGVRVRELPIRLDRLIPQRRRSS